MTKKEWKKLLHKLIPYGLESPSINLIIVLRLVRNKLQPYETDPSFMIIGQRNTLIQNIG